VTLALIKGIVPDVRDGEARDHAVRHQDRQDRQARSASEPGDHSARQRSWRMRFLWFELPVCSRRPRWTQLGDLRQL